MFLTGDFRRRFLNVPMFPWSPEPKAYVSGCVARRLKAAGEKSSFRDLVLVPGLRD